MFKNILIPTDGSEQSQRAVHKGVELAKVHGARVTGIHVIPDYHLLIAYEGAFDPVTEERIEEEAKTIRARHRGPHRGIELREVPRAVLRRDVLREVDAVQVDNVELVAPDEDVVRLEIAVIDAAAVHAADRFVPPFGLAGQACRSPPDLSSPAPRALSHG